MADQPLWDQFAALPPDRPRVDQTHTRWASVSRRIGATPIPSCGIGLWLFEILDAYTPGRGYKRPRSQRIRQLAGQAYCAASYSSMVFGP